MVVSPVVSTTAISRRRFLNGGRCGVGVVTAGVLLGLPVRAAAGAAPCELGMNIGDPFSEDRAPLIPQYLYSVLQASGTRSVRLHLVNGGFGDDWEGFCRAYKGYIDKLIQHGVGVIGLLSSQTLPGTPEQWNANSYETQGKNGANPYLEKLSDFFAFMAARWQGKVRRYEIWNEPNEPASAINPSNLVDLLTKCYLKLRWDNIRGVRLTSGGVYAQDIQGYSRDGSGATYIDRLLYTGLHATGQFAWLLSQYGECAFDEVGTHLYVSQTGGMQVSDIRGINAYLDFYKAIIAHYGLSAGVRITEAGWEVGAHATSTAQQASNMVNLIAICRQRDDVAGLMIYKLMDESTDARWGVTASLQEGYLPRQGFYNWAQANGVQKIVVPPVDWS
jgi:hypothetical protein